MTHDTYVQRHLIRTEAQELNRAEALDAGLEYTALERTIPTRTLTAQSYSWRCMRRTRERKDAAMMRMLMCTLLLLWWAVVLALLVG